MNATITNTPAAFARVAFEKAKSLHEQCQSEIAAGRFVWSGPSICPQEGDGVSEKVPSNQQLRASYAAATNLLNDHLDRLVGQETGFGGSFNDLVEAQRKNGYRPSFYEKSNPAVAVLADAYDFVATLWGLPLTSFRPEQAKPEPKPALTLQSLKAKLKHLRGEARRDTKSIDARFFRSSGTEVRFGGDADVDYCFVGEWDGTLKQLKSLAEDCRSRGGKIVSLSGHWKCGDNLEDIFDPTDCEWEVNLTPDEILAIGKKS